MIDEYWSSVCGEEIEYNKLYTHQSDRSIVSKAALRDLSDYIVREVDHLNVDTRCDASASSINDFLTGYIGRDFVNRDGKYMKRVSKELRGIGFVNIKKHTNPMSQIVNEGILQGEIVEFSFTNTLDWKDGEYGDGGSCFWSCHSHNRDMLEAEGHGAILFYKKGSGIARVWALKAMFDGVRYLGLTNFYNRYASLRRLDMAYAVEKRFDLKSSEWYLNSNIYMNGDSMLLGKTLPAKSKTKDYTWVEIESFRGGRYDQETGDGGDRAECCSCGDWFEEDEMYYVEGDMLCYGCAMDNSASCWSCGERHYHDNTTYFDRIIGRHSNCDGSICDGCLHNYGVCANCDAAVLNDLIFEVGDEWYCSECAEEKINEEEENDK